MLEEIDTEYRTNVSAGSNLFSPVSPLLFKKCQRVIDHEMLKVLYEVWLQSALLNNHLESPNNEYESAPFRSSRSTSFSSSSAHIIYRWSEFPLYNQPCLVNFQNESKTEWHRDTYQIQRWWQQKETHSIE